MELGEQLRPKEVPHVEIDAAPREQCSVCCALRVSALFGSAVFALTFFPNLVVQEGPLLGGSVRGFANRFLFLPLPLTAVCFTHQFLVSQSLWSKNKKTIWEINMQCLGLNTALWAAIIGASTFVSRRVMVHRSRAYRTLIWDYQRRRRTAFSKWMPPVHGELTRDMDWFAVASYVNLYHIFWLVLSVGLESAMRAHYAMYYQDSNYSRWCSPRWREWREQQINEKLNNTHRPLAGRWGSMVTLDPWRSSTVR